MENLKKQIQHAVDAFKSGRILEAEDLTRKLIDSNPKVVFLYNLMGLILSAQKEIDKALEYYEKGIKIDPNFSMIYNNLALLFTHDKIDIIKAENFYKKSISLNYKNPEAHNNLGALYKSLDKFKEAISCFEEAVSIAPRFFQAYHNLGNTYTSMGDFVEAKKNFEEAIKIFPNYTNSHRTLSRIINYANDEKHLHEMKKIYKQIDINDTENKTNIAFALGKAYEDIKDFDKSFKFYNEANNIYNKKVNFSIIFEKEKCQKIKNTFSKKIFDKYIDCGSSGASSIFILGMPRSGTTLIEQILSNHPRVYGGDERDFITDLLIENFGKKFDNVNLYFEGVMNFDKENFRKMGEKYSSKMKDLSKNSEKYTDKMPENFFWIGYIKLILPNSKIIHCYRNPKDNCLSIYKNHFPGGKINYSYELTKIVDYYNLYSDLMHYWNNLLPNFIYNIKYENLISNPEDQIRSLLNACKLDWNNDCLNFHNNKRIVKTASDVQARSKLYNSSVNSWKNYEKFLKKYFEKLNN